MLKKALKIVGVSSILFIILYIFILSDYNPIFEHEEFVFINKEVKNAQKQNLKPIVDIHNKIYQEIKEASCPCQALANNIVTDVHNTSLVKRAFYLLKIKKEFSPDECLKFVLMNYDFGNKNIGIKEASKFYFNKNIDNLNEKEIITLVVMLKNSALYSPIRNPKGVANKVKIFQAILNRQKKYE